MPRAKSVVTKPSRSLTQAKRDALAKRLEARLTPRADGTIVLEVRALTLRGVRLTHAESAKRAPDSDLEAKD